MTAPVRAAATVILLRDEPAPGQAGIEVWLLRRVSAMAFAAGASVFPGGRVDAVDGSDDVAWAGADPAGTAERFGCAVPAARAAWDSFPPGARKNALAMIALAKLPETKTKRITAIVDKAARGERP